VKISDFCYVSDYVANGSFESLRNNVNYLDDGYAVLVRLTDFTKKWQSDFRYVSENAYKFLKHSKLYAGDLIMANVGDPGIVFIVPDLKKPMTLGPNSILIRPTSSVAHTKFIYWYFKSELGCDQITSITSATAQKKFNKTAFRALDIKLPPLAEQQRVAAVLDTADRILKQRESAIAKLDQLAQSVFVEMFGSSQNFENKKLSEVCDLITDGTHYTPTYVDNGVVFLSAKNVTKGTIDWNRIKYVPESLHKELQKRVSPKKGDILLAKNGTTGVAAIVDRDVVFDIYVSLALLRPKDLVDKTFLHAALNSTLTKRQFNSALKGIGVPNLHLVEIRKVTIPVPSVNEQKKFVEILDKINNLRTYFLKSELLIKNKISSLQHQSFAVN
jgi:type I restriction enzyme S subunit